MYVNHSGWSADIGSFSYDIYMDENKKDYEIRYADGSVDRQITPLRPLRTTGTTTGTSTPCSELISNMIPPAGASS